MTEIISSPMPQGGLFGPGGTLSPAGRAFLQSLQDISDVMSGVAARDVSLTATEIKALNATPKTLVPAPGDGKALVFEGAVLFFDAGATAYDGIASGEDLGVRYTNGSGTQVAGCEATGLLDQSTDQIRYVRPFAAASGDSSLTPIEDAALVLHMSTGEIASGDGVLRLRVFYRIIPTIL